MMRIHFLLFTFLICQYCTAQDSLGNSIRPDSVCKLSLHIPVFDFPQNTVSQQRYPSMIQAEAFSTDLYELGYWGIDGLGDKLFRRKGKEYTTAKRIGNFTFKYLLGLGFSKYGSELPIPLGVWAHEEFHRSVLAVNGISSKNGNWILHRWDGTVYGVSDSALYNLKRTDNDQLLYSYVAGVQFEIFQNQKITVQDFYKKRSLYKNSLLLYNAYYVYNYFKFSTSTLSDSVKRLAAPHESKSASERDFAGADLTAWAYDMFWPDSSYFIRDHFPEGEGVNRRIGFSELPADAQQFLNEQKKLSLINFFNPAIFFVNRINIGKAFSFNMLASYAPTHFGNAIGVHVPVKYKNFDFLLNLTNYNNYQQKMYGLGVALYNYPVSKKWSGDIAVSLWEQPRSFFETERIKGGKVDVTAKYSFNKNLQAFISFSAKTDGWQIGDPYLKKNESFQIGINYAMYKPI